MSIMSELSEVWRKTEDSIVLPDEIRRHQVNRMERNLILEVHTGSVSPRGENPPSKLPDFTHGVENPLPYFENAFREVTGLMERYCCTYGVSRAEFITEMRQQDPLRMGRFWRLHDIVDCDVYGRWCRGSLTSEELSQFCRAVDRWVDYSRSLFATPSESTQSQGAKGPMDNG